jgi:hypothetical protein
MNFGPIAYKLKATEFNDMKRMILKKNPYIEMPSDKYVQTDINLQVTNFSIMAGISANPNRELLIGVDYISGDRRGFKFSNSSRRTIDTLHVKDYTFYIDSSYYKSLSYTEQVSEVGMNLSYIFKSDPERKFSIFAGIGVNAGYSVYSEFLFSIEEDSSETMYLKNDPDHHSYSNDHDNTRTEKEAYIKSDPCYFLRAYIPFGFSLRFSKKNVFWKHISLQFQSQLGLEYRNITNDIAFARVYGYTGIVGFKFSF